MAEDPYSRLYWRLVDDQKFVEIYGDDHHFAVWCRLLMLADQAWPASAHIPARARVSSIRKLSDVGLIDLLPGGRFKMHGTDREREKRSEHARTAATTRWHGSGNAAGNAQLMRGHETGNAQLMPSKAEQSQAKQSTAPRTNEIEADRSKQINDRMQQRRLEWFRETGKWDPDWGPAPA